MVNTSQQSALNALHTVVSYDRSLISDPVRIRAALLDLAADDDIGVELIVLTVRLDVPQLVTEGGEAAARLRLVDSAGMRADVARTHVAAWRNALGIQAGDDGNPADGEGYLDVRTAAPVVELRALDSADCQVWADGSVSVLVLGMDGLALATFDTPVQAGAASWHRIATPHAPVSRAAVMVPVDASTSTIIWTDNSGLWGRSVRRTVPGGAVEIGDARIIDAPGAGQARYPIAALAVDGREIDLFWTVDRRGLLVSTRNGLGDIERRSVPSPCQPPERLTALDCAVASETTAWVAALTDRGRLLLTRWDVGDGELDGWRVLACPVSDLRALTIVRLPAGVSAIVSDSHGLIGCADAAAAYAGSATWTNLDLPTRPYRWTGLSSLAASSRGDVAWAVAAVDGYLQLIRLQRYDEVTTAIECLAVR